MSKDLVSRKSNLSPADKRVESIKFIDEQFNVSKTVGYLHNLMTEVTKKEVTADTVNAACNCVQNLNLTIKTAMQAAKFLANEKLNSDD